MRFGTWTSAYDASRMTTERRRKTNQGKLERRNRFMILWFYEFMNLWLWLTSRELDSPWTIYIYPSRDKILSKPASGFPRSRLVVCVGTWALADDASRMTTDRPREKKKRPGEVGKAGKVLWFYEFMNLWIYDFRFWGSNFTHPDHYITKMWPNGKKRWVVYTDVNSFCANAYVGNRRRCVATQRDAIAEYATRAFSPFGHNVDI